MAIFSNIKKGIEDKKNKVEELETRYDKKYNGFCLAISKYDKDQIANLMNKKAIELKLAQDNLKESKDKDERVELKIKIDYLKNVIMRCKTKLKNYKEED